MAFCMSKKPSRFDRLSVDRSFHVAAARMAVVWTAAFLTEAKKALPKAYVLKALNRA